MSVEPSFQVASERLELHPNAVASIANGLLLKNASQLKMAFGLLQALEDDQERYGNILRQAIDQLSTVSDGAIEWKHGRGLSGLVRGRDATFPHFWSSAHEAALEISGLALRFFFDPLRDKYSTDRIGSLSQEQRKKLAKQQQSDFRKLLSAPRRRALAMTMQEVAQMQERIRRERAKYLQLQGELKQRDEQDDHRSDDGVVVPDGFCLDGVLVDGLTDNELALLKLALDKQPDGPTEDDVCELSEFKSWPRHRIDKLLSTIKGKFLKANSSRVLRWANRHLVFRKPRNVVASKRTKSAGRKKGESLQTKGRHKRRR